MTKADVFFSSDYIVQPVIEENKKINKIPDLCKSHYISEETP